MIEGQVEPHGALRHLALSPLRLHKEKMDEVAAPTHSFEVRNQLLACTVCCAGTFRKQRQKQTVPRTYTPLSIETWALRYWHAAQWLTIPRKNQAVGITPFVRQLLHGEGVGRRNCFCQRLAAKTRADRWLPVRHRASRRRGRRRNTPTAASTCCVRLRSCCKPSLYIALASFLKALVRLGILVQRAGFRHHARDRYERRLRAARSEIARVLQRTRDLRIGAATWQNPSTDTRPEGPLPCPVLLAGQLTKRDVVFLFVGEKRPKPLTEFTDVRTAGLVACGVHAHEHTPRASAARTTPNCAPCVFGGGSEPTRAPSLCGRGFWRGD